MQLLRCQQCERRRLALLLRRDGAARPRPGGRVEEKAAPRPRTTRPRAGTPRTTQGGPGLRTPRPALTELANKRGLRRASTNFLFLGHPFCGPGKTTPVSSLTTRVHPRTTPPQRGSAGRRARDAASRPRDVSTRAVRAPPVPESVGLRREGGGDRRRRAARPEAPPQLAGRRCAAAAAASAAARASPRRGRAALLRDESRRVGHHPRS